MNIACGLLYDINTLMCKAKNISLKIQRNVWVVKYFRNIESEQKK